MYIIDHDPEEVIPNINEKMLETKFIITTIQGNNYKWIAILDYSDNDQYLLSWYGTEYHYYNSPGLHEWTLGNRYNSDDCLITKLINTWKDTQCHDQTIFFICDTIQEVQEILKDNNINKCIESQIIEFCKQRSFIC